MQTQVEVRYAGVTIARASAVRDVAADGIFVVVAEPMPVATLLELRVGDALAPVRVDRTAESADPMAAGMRVVFTDAAGRALVAALAAEPPSAAPPPAAVAPPAAVEPTPPASEPAIVGEIKTSVVDTTLTEAATASAAVSRAATEAVVASVTPSEPAAPVAPVADASSAVPGDVQAMTETTGRYRSKGRGRKRR